MSAKVVAHSVCTNREFNHSQGVLREALGLGHGLDSSLNGLAQRLQPYLVAQPDEDGDRVYRGLRTAPDLHDELLKSENVHAAQSSLPVLSLARWPEGAPFALFLSHDIDQIYDRELFRILADINHVRRRLHSGETGDTPLACRRVFRAVFSPKRTLLDFETILDIAMFASMLWEMENSNQV